MAEFTARYKPGENVSGYSPGLVNAGRFVKVSADKTTRGDYSIAQCGAGDVAFGVAERDVLDTTMPAHAQDLLTNVVRRGAIARVTAGATLTAGQAVQSDAVGKAIPKAAGALLGYAMSGTASGAVAEIDLV